MDQDVIKNFKHYYRSLVVQKILAGENLDTSNKITINILQAAQMCSSAWDQVIRVTIANMFLKGDFVRKEDAVRMMALEGLRKLR